MSWECETINYPIAKKRYPCEASAWLCNMDYDECELTDAERQSIKNAKADDWEILPGQEYVKVEGKWEGEWSVFRARKDIDAICERLGIYDC